MDNSKKSVRFLIPLVAGLLVVGFTYFGSERSHAAPIPQPKPKARLRLLCTQAMNEASSDGSFSSFTLVLDPDGSAVASLVSLNETELKYLNGIIDDMNKRLAEKPIKNQQGQPATPDEIKGMRQYLENLQTVVGASGNILLQAFANPYSKAGGNKITRVTLTHRWMRRFGMRLSKFYWTNTTIPRERKFTILCTFLYLLKSSIPRVAKLPISRA